MPHLPTPCLAPIAGKTRRDRQSRRGEMPRSGEIWGSLLVKAEAAGGLDPAMDMEYV